MSCSCGCDEGNGVCFQELTEMGEAATGQYLLDQSAGCIPGDGTFCPGGSPVNGRYGTKSLGTPRGKPVSPGLAQVYETVRSQVRLIDATLEEIDRQATALKATRGFKYLLGHGPDPDDATDLADLDELACEAMTLRRRVLAGLCRACPDSPLCKV
jgi:hypothetical protein